MELVYLLMKLEKIRRIGKKVGYMEKLVVVKFVVVLIEIVWIMVWLRVVLVDL